MLPAADIERARERGFDEIAAEVALKRAGPLQTGRCPFHGPERTPSFYVYPDRHWHCFGCGAHGDAIGFVMRLRGLAFQAAVAWLLDARGARETLDTREPVQSVHRETESRTSDRVRAILRECGPVVEGTAAWLWLWMRGLKTKQPALLYHPALYVAETKEHLPALVSPITNSRNEVCALQRTWLLSRVELTAGIHDNRPALSTRKKSLGTMSDGAVRLGTAGPVLGLAEGTETSIASSMLYKVPCWSVCGAARLATVWIPNNVQQLLIFADNGNAGMAAAERAKDAHVANGLRCDIVYPSGQYDDFNSELLGRER